MYSKSLIFLSLLASGLFVACDDSSSLAPGVRSDPVTAYARVDRMGQPAVATALLQGSGFRQGVPMNGADNERDAFNQGNPGGDGDFAGAFVDTLIVVNNALADDLDSLSLPRCSTGAPGEIDEAAEIMVCVNQAAPVVIPDVITLDLTAPNGWPNGRLPDDPVVDRILAAVLLDLGQAGLDTFADLPLNPPGNDARADDPSPANFPYLRAPLSGS